MLIAVYVANPLTELMALKIFVPNVYLSNVAIPPQIWLITDTHFNHAAMVKYCGRPENHTEIILENWSKAVRDCDVTIHLGDVIIGRDSEMQGMLATIPGKKILTLGNHDQHKPMWYMQRGFDFAADGIRIGDIYFSHFPVTALPYGCTMNIHGHYHNTDHRTHEFYKEKWHYLLAIEKTDYKPVLLTDFLKSL